jgi:replicative DNA helicase
MSVTPITAAGTRAPVAPVPPADPLARMSAVEAEQALIGAALINNAVHDLVAGIVQADDFIDPTHRQAWGWIAGEIEAGRRADLRTMAPVCRTWPWPGDDPAGLTAYFARCMAAVPAVISAPDYARAVADMARRREVWLAGQDAQAAALDLMETDVEALATRAMAAMEAASGGRWAGRKHSFDMGDVMDAAFDEIERSHRGEVGARGASTGLATLDEVIGGLARGTFTVVAGRPSMGKSAFAGKLMQGATLRAGDGVALFSLEMAARTWGRRLLADVSGIPLDALHREPSRLMPHLRALKALPIVIDDTGGASLAHVRAGIRRARARCRAKGADLAVVIVDYLQLMAGDPRHGNNRNAEISDISAGLVKCAKDFDVAMVALSQLNRKVEERDDKRPRMADLRDSGAIEQDADNILFLFREAYYLAREGKLDDQPHLAGIAEVIVAKQRDGRAPVTVRTGFDALRSRFFDLRPDDGGGPDAFA